jgi:hypothetical protein
VNIAVNDQSLPVQRFPPTDTRTHSRVAHKVRGICLRMVKAQHASRLKILFTLGVIDAATRNLAISKPQRWRRSSRSYRSSLKHFTRRCITCHRACFTKSWVHSPVHNWNFPIQFPSDLLLDSFLASVQHQPIIFDSSDGGCSLTTRHTRSCPRQAHTHSKSSGRASKKYGMIKRL